MQKEKKQRLDNGELTDAEFWEWDCLCSQLAYEIETLHRQPLKSDLARYHELRQKQLVDIEE